MNLKVLKLFTKIYNNKTMETNIKIIENNFKLLNKQFFVRKINKISNIIISRLKKGNKIMFCGNGGSASDSNHLAAELIGRYLKNRRSYNAISLTGNTSTITAIANDFGFEKVFSRQLEGLGRKNDILFAISTSGKSKNILKVLKTAKKLKITSILLTSKKLLSNKKLADIIIKVPATRVDRIQEMHIAIGHVICEKVEKKLR